MPLFPSDRQWLGRILGHRGGLAGRMGASCLRIIHEYMEAAFGDFIHDLLERLHRIVVGHVELVALYSGGEKVFFRFPWQHRRDNSTACHNRSQRSSFALHAKFWQQEHDSGEKVFMLAWILL